MADSFQGLITDKLKVIRDTHRDDTKFNSAIAEDFDKMTYPAAAIIPQNTTYQNDLEYTSGFVVRYVFERSPNHIDWIEAIESVEEATDTVLSDLESDSDSKEFKPTEFQPLVAENSGSRLSIVEVTWQLTGLQDFT
jgi:hypothetical protein